MRTIKCFTGLCLAAILSSCAAMDLEISPEIDPYKVVYNKGEYDIYLSSTIEKADAYIGLIAFINSHRDAQQINIYLSGNGGSVPSVVNLVNTMRASTTKFHMVVYGDVYSGHAFLATAGTTLEIRGGTNTFLYHKPAYGPNADTIEQTCGKMIGTDRGISLEKKCRQLLTKAEGSFNKSVMAIPYKILTPKELKGYLAGEDILIDGKEMQDRLTKQHLLGY